MKVPGTYISSGTFFYFSLFLSYNLLIFDVEKIIAALIGSGNSSNFTKYRDKLQPFGVTFESVDYKEDEHSNHVYRSFITSSVRLSIQKEGMSK